MSCKMDFNWGPIVFPHKTVGFYETRVYDRNNEELIDGDFLVSLLDLNNGVDDGSIPTSPTFLLRTVGRKK